MCYNLNKILLIEEVFYCYITLDNRMIVTKMQKYFPCEVQFWGI